MISSVITTLSWTITIGIHCLQTTICHSKLCPPPLKLKPLASSRDTIRSSKSSSTEQSSTNTGFVNGLISLTNIVSSATFSNESKEYSTRMRRPRRNLNSFPTIQTLQIIWKLQLGRMNYPGLNKQEGGLASMNACYLNVLVVQCAKY
uniref:Uncharacterized protein n=2 Tax=Cacopsylla melanoneura TaxID=428564 RepID=A0A8D8PNI7_9HEMI